MERAITMFVREEDVGEKRKAKGIRLKNKTPTTKSSEQMCSTKRGRER